MIKKKNALSKFLSILAIICFMFSTFPSLPVLAEGANPSLAADTKGQYIINSVEDINKFRTDLNNGIDYTNKIVVLGSDVTITDDVKLTPTTGTFQGFFNGQGHSIKNYNDSLTGFVCRIGSNGVITNLHMGMNVSNAGGLEENSELKPGLYYYGSITNENEGKISLCSVEGTVTTDSRELGENGSFSIGGIAGMVDDSNNTNCVVENCYSRLKIQAKTDDKYVQSAAGIAFETDSSDRTKIIKNCYAAGQITCYEGAVGIGCGSSGNYPSSYYDKDVTTVTDDTLGGVPKSTAEMKQKSTYVGWDFDKIWDIDPSKNDGYPYLKSNQKNDGPVTPAIDMPVDVNINIADKTVSKDGTVDLTADYTCSLTCSDQESIKLYNVKVTLDGKINFSGFTGEKIPMNYMPAQGDSRELTSDVLKRYLKITYDDNKKYKFEIGNVTFNNPNFYGNGITTVPEDEQKQQVEDAKKAEDILYNKLNIGQGDVRAFTWSGNRAAAPGTEGTIVLDDYVWEVFSSARSGYKGVRKGFYDDWFKNIQNGLEKMKEAGITAGDVKMTEWDKLVLAITAIGYDPRDIKAYDLIDIVSNNDYLDVSNQTFSEQYAVMALTSYNYPISQDGKHIDIEKCIHRWAKSALATKGADGSAVLPNSAPDMWTMQFQPIAAYYDPNAKEGDKYYDVKQAMEHVFAQFSNAQTYKGSFWGAFQADYNNPWTNAQVYMTLGMAHANIFDSKYIKNGNSILNGALQFYDIKNGTTEFDNHSYEPAQMCRGLDSLVRAYEGRNSIFDCTDVKNSTVPVNNAITQLPDVDKLTSADKDKVDAAEKLYDALSDAQKSSMKQETVGKLTAAEKKVSGSQGETKPIKITNLTKDSSFKLGNDAKVSVKAENNSGKDKDASLLVALYDGSDKFVKYVCGKQTIKNGNSSILTGIMKLPEEGIYKLKAFVWDSLENMNPLSDIIDISVQSNK
ncbi:cell surface protein [Clostridium sp. AWRP]|uniref:cell surface protein n=1 Tax=Clostridium sp. AWRP TaxID=2212991 RepID=UPI000FDA0B9F|nr:cell surface protein [Clostridium sp. AWRP]AZV57203.1 cell surface protein [Clostridium sp. AWRP]